MPKILLTIAVSCCSVLTAQGQLEGKPQGRQMIQTRSALSDLQENQTRPSELAYPGSTNASPQISSYYPPFGLPGTLVTIRGTGFGSSQGDSYVSVLSATDFHTYTTWPVASWSDTQIVVPVPVTMPPGRVYLIVEVNEQKSPDWHPFTVGIPPQITRYSPSYGAPGTILTINGSVFGESQGSSYVSVLSAATNARTTWMPTSWSDTQIVVPVPVTMPLGKVYLSVIVNGLASIGAYPFTVGVPPQITRYSPSYGAPGTVLTIIGTGFGQSQDSGSVSVLSSVTNSWTSWAPTTWSDSEILVPVPSTMPVGRVYLSVKVNGLASIGTYPFTVGVPPQITGYSPSSGPDGTVLTITGTGFGATQGSSYVTFLSDSNVWTTLTPQSWSDTQIAVAVPSLTPLGLHYLSVTVGGLRSIGTYPFRVTDSPSPN